jgi:hypothetical protein
MEESVLEDSMKEGTTEPGGNGGNGDKKVEPPMTEAQRRYLFRFLSQKGI